MQFGPGDPMSSEMSEDTPDRTTISPLSTPPRVLSPAAARALAEAEARRLVAEEERERPREINGRQGPEPTRFGDWEKNGIISDF